MDTGIKANAEAEAAAYAEAYALAHARAHAAILAHSHPKARIEDSDYADAHAIVHTKHELEAKAKADADADAHSKALIPLRNLATDCLRLSMHFFHPIQQCAQQVYHTAVPLSPTSSLLHKSCLQSIINNQLSHVTSFSGAPHTWGLLLRTIDTRPRQLTCIATSGQRIISACGGIMNIYDAVTGVLQQSINIPKTATKIQGTLDGSILFLAHSSSVTMWDVQTGGLIHTFTGQPKISDIAVSTTHIACGSSNGSVMFWDIHTKGGGKGFGNGQPVVAIIWLSAQVLAVATLSNLYIHNITNGESSVWFSAPGSIWGMVNFEGQLLVGTSWKTSGVGREWYFFKPISYTDTLQPHLHEESLMHGRQLKSPTRMGREIACITPATGVQLFDPRLRSWTESPPLLGTARSLALSLGRNIVVQSNDSIQIFSVDVLAGGKARKDVRPSYIYPLGKKHIVCIQPDRRIVLLESATLQELRPDENTSPLWSLLGNLSPFGRTSLLTNQSPFACASFNYGLVAKLGISSVMHAWQSGTPLPEWTEVADEDVPLSGMSPMCTLVVTAQYSSPRLKLRVEDANDGTVLAKVHLKLDGLGTGLKVYDIAFDSETRFYLKIDGPGGRVQIAHSVIPSPSESYSHRVTKGEPVPLPELRAPPYTLDANCEWVVDTESRKVCWIPPGNLRRGAGGHFWASLSLVMVGDDGIVRKLYFKEPDC